MLRVLTACRTIRKSFNSAIKMSSKVFSRVGIYLNAVIGKPGQSVLILDQVPLLRSWATLASN